MTKTIITEVEVDEATKQAMQIQLNAERVRRGTVTEAEGKKQAAQLRADAELYTAQKKAEATMVLADAEAYAVNAVAKAISNGGASAVEFEIRKIHADFNWQSRFHDHIIRNSQTFETIQNYIVNNPKNWGKDKFCNQ